MEIKQVQLINFINKLVRRKVLGWGLKLSSYFCSIHGVFQHSGRLHMSGKLINILFFFGAILNS